MRQVFLIYIIFRTVSGFGCDCFNSGDNLYEFYSKMSSVYLGKVTKQIDATHYEFQVSKVYKGKTHDKIIIESGGQSSCGLGPLTVGSFCLISPNYSDKNNYWVSRCNLNMWDAGLKDTVTLNAISKTNTYVDVRHFNGQIKSGKRVGRWTEYTYVDTFRTAWFAGNYVNDKRDGIWSDSEGKKYLYKRGKLIKSLADN